MENYKDLFLESLKTVNLTEEMVANDDSYIWHNNAIFHKLFVKPEILVGFYIWRDGDGYDLFMDEFDGWSDDCKEIANEAKQIFEQRESSIQLEL